MSEQGAGPAGAPGRHAFRLLLDADISQEVARVSRALGLDVLSVYEIGRGDLRDDEQLRLAAVDGRLFVTRNRNDFLRWTVEFACMGAPHAGVLLVTQSIPATRPEPLAHALLGWADRMAVRLGGRPLDPYFIDFPSPRSSEGSERG